MKQCKTCGNTFPLLSFYKTKHGYYHSYCKKCHCEKTDYRHKNKQNKQRHYESTRRWMAKNIEKMKLYKVKYNAEYLRKNKSELQAKRKIYENKNKSKILTRTRLYLKNKRDHDISFRILTNMRSRLHQSVKKKFDCTMNLVGCSIGELRNFLEAKFTPGMAWENYGKFGWHIDHITPCAAFDLRNPDQQKQCFHFTNLQPLWAKDNLLKYANY